MCKYNKKERKNIFVSGFGEEGKQTYMFNVLPSDEVQILKSLIKHKTGIPSLQQLLIYAGKVLTNGKLSDYLI